MSITTKKRGRKGWQTRPASDQTKPVEGRMAVDSQYGGTTPKSKSEWKQVGDLAARLVQKAREARDD